MEVTRIFDILSRYEEKFHKDDALCFKQNGQWIKYSSQQYIDYSVNFFYGLYELGFRKGDKIVSISNSRPEWNFIDVGMTMLGVVHVPVFTSLKPSEYEFIQHNCGAKIVIVSDKKLFRCVSPALESYVKEGRLFTFDEVEGARFWLEIIRKGESCPENRRKEADSIRDQITPDDIATLIYTSGTTGSPKGVMLSHRNLVSNFISASRVFNLNPTDKYLSILPLCHVGGRLGNYQTQYCGTSIYYAENMGTIAANMAEVKPDGFDAVPRIIEKFYDVIMSKGKKLTGFKKAVFFWAVKLGTKYNPFGENGLIYEVKLKIADRLVFSKWRQALGGNVRIVGCGGASLLSRLERIFWAAGIRIFNMYGLTETSPIITINRNEKGKVRMGSVGITIEGVEVKIADDGEILCKGPNVMTGYYNDPELTSSAFDEDGWFRTGDVGRIEDGKFLMVTDRKKEIFKLSNGKFVAPQLIENLFKESLMIDQVMVVGEHEKFASAIISPNFKYFEEWRKEKRLLWTDPLDLIRHPEITDAFNSEIESVNKRLNPTERISRFRLVPDEWSPATGELSPTLKLKRQFISNKYREILDQIYMK